MPTILKSVSKTATTKRHNRTALSVILIQQNCIIFKLEDVYFVRVCIFFFFLLVSSSPLLAHMQQNPNRSKQFEFKYSRSSMDVWKSVLSHCMEDQTIKVLMACVRAMHDIGCSRQMHFRGVTFALFDRKRKKKTTNQSAHSAERTTCANNK